MPTHRNNRLDIFGDGAEVEKLYNDRWRVTVRCLPKNRVKDWFYENRGNTFADFASSMGEEIKIDGASQGWGAPNGQPWADAKLISQSLGYTPSGEYVVTFTYETLPTEYTQDRDDEVDYELNGLRRVTRTLIAEEGSDYGKVVGLSTIQHTALGYGEETLYLASVDEIPKGDDDGGYTRIQETWVEQGVLSTSSSNEGEGVFVNNTTYLVSEDAQTAPVRSRAINNFEGLQTISVQTLTDANGNPINNGGENLVHSFDREVDFEYPGEVSIGQTTTSFTSSDGENTANFFDWYYDLSKGPVVKPIVATYFVFYQDSNEIVNDDFTYDGAIGRWAPDEWAKGEINGFSATIDANFNDYTGFRPNSGTRTINKYTSVSPTEKSGVGLTPGSPITLRSIEGQFIYPNNTATISVSGGPGVPDNKRYVLNVDLREGFTDENGDVIWKKTIVVATIPPR